MRPLGPAVAVVLALTLLAPAARAQSPSALAAQLRGDPVYADPRARPTLTPAQAGRVRLEIVERELGRIKIAVVTPRTAAAQGGVRDLANAVDAQLRTPGTLLVIAGDNAWVTTSYPRPQQAVAAVRRAFARPGSLADRLVAAVRNIARVDPGPGQDLQPTSPAEIEDAAEDLVGTVKLIFWIVGALIALPFAIGGLLLVRAVWRSVRASREAVGDERADMREQLVALGEEIRALDAEGGVFESHPGARSAYERAMTAYERADRLLGQADSARRLGRVRAAIAEGHTQIADARDRVGALAPPPTVAAPPAQATPDDKLRDEANRAFGRED